MILPESINLSALPSLPLANRKQLPPILGIYFAIDSLGVVQYIGQSVNIRNRWLRHHRQSQLEAAGNIRIAWAEVSESSLLNQIEQALIDYFDPPLNGLRNKIDRPANDRLRSKLQELMQVKGVDKKTVAAATGLNPATVGKLYRNHFDRIDNHTITSLCEYFGLKDLGQLIELVSEGGS